MRSDASSTMPSVALLVRLLISLVFSIHFAANVFISSVHVVGSCGGAVAIDGACTICIELCPAGLQDVESDSSPCTFKGLVSYACMCEMMVLIRPKIRESSCAIVLVAPDTEARIQGMHETDMIQKKHFRRSCIVLSAVGTCNTGQLCYTGICRRHASKTSKFEELLAT